MRIQSKKNCNINNNNNNNNNNHKYTEIKQEILAAVIVTYIMMAIMDRFTVVRLITYNRRS